MVLKPPALRELWYPSDVWFPLSENWDVQVMPPRGRFRFPLKLPPAGRLELFTDEDLATPKGWVYAGYVTADSGDAGIRLEYQSPKGTRWIQEWTIRDLHNLGLVYPVPGAWICTRWALSEKPEYAAILCPSIIVPYQRGGKFLLINNGTGEATVYDALVTLICLYGME